MKVESTRTFRDPAGYVEFTQTAVRRHVHANHADATLDFLATPVAKMWLRDGSMVTTSVAAQDQDELTLEHPRLFFPSYPWEWAPAQWRAAADLTLELCREAVAQGYILKDATPLNILFDGARPVFVDVLSFEKRKPESDLWMAQAQFMRTFLFPLLGHRYLGWPLAATLLRRDGYEPGQLYMALSPLQRMRPALFRAVTLPTWLEGSANSKTYQKQTGRPKSPELATYVLQRGLGQLKKKIAEATVQLPATPWSEYMATAKHYSETDHAAKREFAARILNETRPRTVLDIGANTGTYSMLAAKAGARVVALDTDPAAIERLWNHARKTKLDVLPLVADIARPTPPVGWENAESFSLLDRMEDKFDLALMLAVIHHLLLMDQIPLERIAALMARIARKHVLVEWAPQSDPMFQALLRGRDAIYAHLQLEALLAAFAVNFRATERCDLANGRSLILFEKI